MPIIELQTVVAAPRERVFDLSRSVELHQHSTADSGERAITGRITGLLEPGEEVTWRARHLGVTQTLTSRITRFDRPRMFRDSMVRGAFARFDHDHIFDETGGGTLMIDRFAFEAPLGGLGRIVERLVLTRYLRRFLVRRNLEIKRVAESTYEWQRYVAGES